MEIDKNAIYENAIKTERAVIHFDNIQHFSWTKQQGKYEVKIYSNAGYIIQPMDKNTLDVLILNYLNYTGVK